MKRYIYDMVITRFEKDKDGTKKIVEQWTEQKYTHTGMTSLYNRLIDEYGADHIKIDVSRY